MLWGLGVGYVISGMYFGWNLGLEKGGTLGLAVATLFIIVMYLTFTFSYTELACAIPKAGHWSRFVSAETWKPPSSASDEDSPVPNSTRPFETRSSVAMRSATRAGWL